MALGRTAKYYRDNPEARKKRLAYQKRYNARKAQIERRVRNNRENRELGTYGNGDKKDVSHKGRRIVLEAQSKNRASKTNTPGDKRARGKNKGNKGGK
jgi:hypothetical protein